MSRAVARRMRKIGVTLGVLCLLVAGCGAEPPTMALMPEELLQSPDGEPLHFSLVGFDSAGERTSLNGFAVWASSDQAIATVASDGTVTPVSPGVATISATRASEVVTARVTISDVNRITGLIAPPTIAIAAGDTDEVPVQAMYTDGIARDVSAVVHWHVDDPAVASPGAFPGELVAAQPGTTPASITIDDAAMLVDITVTDGGASGAGDAAANTGSRRAPLHPQADMPPPRTLTRVDIVPQQLELYAMTPRQLRARAHFSDGTTKIVTRQATWASDNAALVPSPRAGVVRSIGNGDTGVTATFAGMTAHAAIRAHRMKPPRVLNPTPFVGVGVQQPYRVISQYEDGQVVDLTSATQWTSEAPAVAAVNGSGVVRGVSPGATTIRGVVRGWPISIPIRVGPYPGGGVSWWPMCGGWPVYYPYPGGVWRLPIGGGCFPVGGGGGGGTGGGGIGGIGGGGGGGDRRRRSRWNRWWRRRWHRRRRNWRQRRRRLRRQRGHGDSADALRRPDRRR